MSGPNPDAIGQVSVSAAGSGGQRADAQRNRDRILTAARELLAGSGGELRLNAVARASGVGQGTLYRHFPTRGHLLAAVYRSEVEDLVAAASALVATHRPPAALGAWLERVAAYARVKRDVFAAVEAETSSDLAAHSLGAIGEAIDTLLAAGRGDGSLRPDAQARDVITLISWLSRVSDDDLDERGPRLLGILLEGLRAQPPTRLLEPPTTA